MKTIKIGLIIVIPIVTIWILIGQFWKDSYIGFYYPDANNLANDIQSDGFFDSLEACRDWIDEQVSIHNADGASYDYECGKNCDLSGDKPYICEETLE